MVGKESVKPDFFGNAPYQHADDRETLVVIRLHLGHTERHILGEPDLDGAMLTGTDHVDGHGQAACAGSVTSHKRRYTSMDGLVLPAFQR